MRSADVIVVGLGAMGSAASWQLAARGVSVIGIDQYAPPHAWGSTHGDTRITRLAIGEGREYVPLARRSHELWRDIERDSGAELLTQPGIVIMAHPSSAFLAETRAAARQYGIAHQDLSNDELRAGFPMFAVDQETVGYHEPEAGYVRPERAVAAQLALAARCGAQLSLSERVEGWTASANGVMVTTDRETYVAGQLLLCAGAWIGDLMVAVRDLVAIYRQLLFWFPIRHGYAVLRDMPAFVWDVGGDRRGFVHLDGFYGFPAIDGPGGGVKVATESYEHTTTPDGRQHPARSAEIERMYRGCIEPYLRWLGPEPLRTVSCLYTSTRGSRFIIDRHPDHDAVMVVSACSGHGFKHSPAIGEAVAQWMRVRRRRSAWMPSPLTACSGPDLCRWPSRLPPVPAQRRNADPTRVPAQRRNSDPTRARPQAMVAGRERHRKVLPDARHGNERRCRRRQRAVRGAAGGPGHVRGHARVPRSGHHRGRASCGAFRDGEPAAGRRAQRDPRSSLQTARRASQVADPDRRRRPGRRDGRSADRDADLRRGAADQRSGPPQA
jgi:sarcosine oxidase